MREKDLGSIPNFGLKSVFLLTFFIAFQRPFRGLALGNRSRPRSPFSSVRQRNIGDDYDDDYDDWNKPVSPKPSVEVRGRDMGMIMMMIMMTGTNQEVQSRV